MGGKAPGALLQDWLQVMDASQATLVPAWPADSTHANRVRPDVCEQVRWQVGAKSGTVGEQQLCGFKHGMALLRQGGRGYHVADQPHCNVPAGLRHQFILFGFFFLF